MFILETRNEVIIKKEGERKLKSINLQNQWREPITIIIIIIIVVVVVNIIIIHSRTALILMALWLGMHFNRYNFLFEHLDLWLKTPPIGGRV